MSSTCAGFQIVQASRSFPSSTAQFRLRQKVKTIRHGQSAQLAFGGKYQQASSLKRLEQVRSYSEGIMAYTSEGSNTQMFNSDEGSYYKNDDKVVDGFELVGLGNSDDIYEYLNEHFRKADGLLDVVPAMAYLGSALSVFKTSMKRKPRNTKISKTYELVFEDLKAELRNLGLSDKVVCMESIGIVNAIVYASTFRFHQGLAFFRSLLEDVLDRKDDLSTDELCTVATALTNFKQFDDREKILVVLDAIRDKFLQASPQQKFNLLDVVRLMRCRDEQILQNLQQGILDGTLVPQSQENVNQVLQFLSAVGEYRDETTLRVLRVLVDQYLQLPNLESHETNVRIIFSAAWLGGDASLVQKIVDETMYSLDEEQLALYDDKFCLGMLRRANILLEPNGRVQYPGIIAEGVNDDKMFQEQQLRKNPKSEVVNEHLGVSFYNYEVEDRPVIEGEMRADMSIQSGDRKVAVATRTSTSFTYTEPRKLLGQTKASFQQLENRGWQVYVVDGDKFYVDNEYQSTVVKEIKEYLESEYEVESNWKSM